MKQNKYGTWAVGAFMLLLSAAACTDSYESTPVDMFTEPVGGINLVHT